MKMTSTAIVLDVKRISFSRPFFMTYRERERERE